MDDQQNLFDYRPSEQGSDTSEAAARYTHANTDAARVYRYIKSRGALGSTDEEVESALDMRHQTASARRRGLVLQRLITDSGRKRATSTGCKAVVWVLA